MKLNCYIDGENLNIDFIKTNLIKLNSKYNINQKKIYYPVTKNIEKINKLLIENIIQPIICLKYGSKKNSIDIQICIDIMEDILLDSSLDGIILFSSDSDFSPLLRKLKIMNKFVIVVCYNIHKSLKSLCDIYINEYNICIQSDQTLTNEINNEIIKIIKKKEVNLGALKDIPKIVNIFNKYELNLKEFNKILLDHIDHNKFKLIQKNQKNNWHIQVVS